jgi:hypothetical protein
MTDRFEEALEELIAYIVKYEEMNAAEAKRLIVEGWEVVDLMLDPARCGAPLYRIITDELLRQRGLAA